MALMDSKTIVRSLLIGNSTLTALVPAARIQMAWPNSTQVFPCVVYREVVNSQGDEDYHDNVARSATVSIQIDIFTLPNVNPFPIAAAIDNIMNLNLWNRDGSEDLIEDDGKVHRVVKYSTRLYN